MHSYWQERYLRGGRIWGDQPSPTAALAVEFFQRHGVQRVLVPGAGYGRNAAHLSRAGFKVTGVEVSAEAIRLAEQQNPGISYLHGSFLEVPLEPGAFDAIYCYNVLHLFLKAGRERFLQRCRDGLREGGLLFVAVFSDEEASYGRGPSPEENTFESKPGRPVHYFSAADLDSHFRGFEILARGQVNDPEEHGDQGPHVHRLRYAAAARRPLHEFDGERYRAAAGHQREWGERLISGLELQGDENILDLGCGDGTVTARLAARVPRGAVLGLDASAGMIAAARPLAQENLQFRLQDISNLDFEGEFDLIFSNSAMHWLKDQRRLLASCHRALREGGRLCCGFPGAGSAAGFIRAVKQAMSEPIYRHYFADFAWPWLMPEAPEYEALLVEAGFREVSVQMQINDRSFNAAQLTAFIDQPAIVPFLARVSEADKSRFREQVVQTALEVTARGEDQYFEAFRRLVVSARK
jgi:trans-aconitate 2-methyltransferase